MLSLQLESLFQSSNKAEVPVLIPMDESRLNFMGFFLRKFAKNTVPVSATDTRFNVD